MTKDPRVPYSALTAYCAPARPRSEIWRLLVGLVGIVVLYLGLNWLALAYVLSHLPPFRAASVLQTLAAGSSPEGLMMLLATFVPMAAAVIFVTRALHGRAGGTLFGAQAWTNARRVAAPLIALAVLLLPLALLNPDVGNAGTLAQSLRWMPLALPLLAIQIGAEELVFRGYMLQQLAARTTNPILWMVVPSALFGALHYSTADFGANAIWPALWAFAFGCLAADLTARTGNLGAALGLHFATNFSAMFLVGLYGQLDGLALYTVVINTRDTAMLAPYMAIDAIAMLVSWLLARVILRV